MPALEEYRKRRDFVKTPEPSGGNPKGNENTFVVQKHASRTLHFDFRLSVGGVLKSWAVPKGPSMNPSDKRLAVPTEDHPLDYAGFEGTIPEGEYGAGTVMVWDRGTYENRSRKDHKDIPIEKGLENGLAKFMLNGTRLKGAFALVRSGTSWLLIKMKDSEAGSGDPVKEESRSALSGRTMEEISKAGKP
jgi:DNA ligase D-like protein (predicted 3'-phosphoesterase)